MFVIGQGINILNEKIFRAVRERDKKAVRLAARRQLEKGADGLDICLGTGRNCSCELSWLVEQVRNVSDCPLFLSPCPEGLSSALEKAGSNSFINCVTADARRLESMLSAAQCLDASLVVLLTRKGCLPAGLDEICMVAEEVLETAEKRAFPINRLVLDPVLRPRTACFRDKHETIRPDITLFMEAVYLIGRLREPKVKTIAGLSNITTGLPGSVQTRLQVQVLNLLGTVGLDYVIMHAGSRELIEAAKTKHAQTDMEHLAAAFSLSEVSRDLQGA